MNCVLITGVTGAIASELVPLLLESDDCEVRLIIRADSATHLRERLNGLFAYWGLKPADRSVSERVEAFRGDVCQPQLALDDATYRRLSRNVTNIIHCAGNVKLNQSLEEARANALGAAQQIVEFAEACQQQGSFTKLDVVSTIGVAGRMTGVIPEQPLPGPRSFHNNYEAAKAEAEEFLFQKLADGVPLTVHRPSMVVGDSKTGRILHFQVFYHLCDFLSGKKTWGFMVDTGDVMLDIVPVDYVARAITLASQDQHTVGRIFHLCSGPELAIRLADLRNHVRDFAARNGEKHPPLHLVSPAHYRKCLSWASRLAWGRTHKALRALAYLLAYLDEVQTFDVTETARHFSACGLQVPSPDSYLERLLAYRQAVASSQPAAAQPPR